MPTSLSLPDAQVSANYSASSNSRVVVLTFKSSPRLTGAFRCGKFEGVSNGILYDRNFDLHYRLTVEAGPWPALAIGLRDMVGKGVNSAEYIVANKALGSGVSTTVGLGWGRMGSCDGVANPFGWDTRELDVGLGGRADAGAWFHGPMAPFGGLAWQANTKTRLTIEYSSDARQQEVDSGKLDYRTPTNLGVS